MTPTDVAALAIIGLSQGASLFHFVRQARRVAALESGRLTQAQSIARATDLIGKLLERIESLEVRASEQEEEIGLLYAELFEDEEPARATEVN